jgi:hypothetical protein
MNCRGFMGLPSDTLPRSQQSKAAGSGEARAFSSRNAVAGSVDLFMWNLVHLKQTMACTEAPEALRCIWVGFFFRLTSTKAKAAPLEEELGLLRLANETKRF